MALLAGAIRYALNACAPVGPAEMALPTPCAEWDLGALLDHLGESMADLETALGTGRLDDPGPRPDCITGDRVELIRERAAALLCAAYDPAGAAPSVAVAGLPMPAALVACTGAVEITVHGWDVSAARRGDPIPAALATRMLGLCPLLVAGREGLFAGPVQVPAGAGPGDRLVGYLGRDPGWPAARRLAEPAAPPSSGPPRRTPGRPRTASRDRPEDGSRARPHRPPALPPSGPVITIGAGGRRCGASCPSSARWTPGPGRSW